MIYISLGSNLGNRMQYLQDAVAMMETRGVRNIRRSIVLETEAITPENAPTSWNIPYLNMVIAGETDLEPEALLDVLKEIERDLGRPEQYERWSPRVIDLDILLWDGRTHKTPRLTIPHAELKNRPFFGHLLSLLGVSDIGPVPFIRSMALSPKLVGILNVTPDSFSDGAPDASVDDFAARALALCADGASVVDIGACSTRPDATILDADAERARLAPVLDALSPHLNNRTLSVSIDTFQREVITWAIDRYKIDWVNDVTGRLDADTLSAIAARGIRICAMHALSVPPRRDETLPRDAHPMPAILRWAQAKGEELVKAGFKPQDVILDPGIGFGKTAHQNIRILQTSEQLRALGFPVLIGHSRKSFIPAISGDVAANARDPETIAASCALADKVDYLRVHNVRDHMRFLSMYQTIRGTTV